MEEALDGFVQSHTGGDENCQHDRETGELLAPEAAEEVCDSERYGRERVAEVVDQVREQRNGVRYEEDRELRDSSEAEDRKAERNCFDALARANDRAVDEAVRMAVMMRVAVMVAVLVGVTPINLCFWLRLGLAKAKTSMTMRPGVRVDMNSTPVTMWRGSGSHSAWRSKRP